MTKQQRIDCLKRTLTFFEEMTADMEFDAKNGSDTDKKNATDSRDECNALAWAIEELKKPQWVKLENLP